jgi:hypothetical protein
MLTKWTAPSILAASILAMTALGAPAVASTDQPTFVGHPKLLLGRPAGSGYTFVFRLSHPVARRSDGSFDAGTRTAAGFDSELMQVDKRNFCYFATALGHAKHPGVKITVSLLLGDGSDPTGHVHSVHTLRARVTSQQGTAGGKLVNGRRGSFKAESAAARRLGCTHLGKLGA